MDLWSNEYRVEIGAYVHPVMIRRQMFHATFGGDYEEQKNRVLGHFNLYQVDIHELKFHADRVMADRLRQLTVQTAFNIRVAGMYQWMQSQPGLLHKEIYVDVLIMANSPIEKKGSIEFYLSHKYGYHTESFQQMNQFAYRL